VYERLGLNDTYQSRVINSFESCCCYLLRG
jgi:hypothetical protein